MSKYYHDTNKQLRDTLAWMDSKRGKVFQEERDLVFPFMIVPEGMLSSYEVSQGTKEDCVKFTQVSPEFHIYDNHVTKDECKGFIKNGTWIVKSVGEQKPSKAPPSDVEPSELDSYMLKIAQATELFKGFTEAARDANMALVTLHKTFEEIKNV